ncbi:hypothetical protein [Aneurinibacillus terranovensis]|uniref:hypothetical protein n=1 Tax=Aneurinibacillus terranovensis TaxID=278991 RepID=UPI00040F3EF3|nr:hypothetical protein [Aneurinibacillus terranovensis]
MFLRYVLFSMSVITGLVILKINIFPYLLWQFGTVGDTGAVLYEMLCLALGGLALIVYLAFGHCGRYKYRLRADLHFLASLLLQWPFIIPGWSDMRPHAPATWMYSFIEGWCSLLAEPIRLLLFTYPWTDILAVFLSLLLIFVGRRAKFSLP